jgi:methionyl aminopeptidase
MTKEPQELALLAESGRLLASVFGLLDRTSLAGISTLQINDMVERFIVDELKARPASKGQYGYGFVLNSSVNDVVCHGVPSQSKVLRDGDIVNFDITLEKNGYIADSSKTYLVGAVHPAAKRLVRITYEAMWMGIRAVRPGARLGDIGWAIERHAKRHGYSVVREYCGHGIGREMHEEPQVLHYGKPGTGLALREGMVFTIEPMLNRGRRSVRTDADGWTVVTRDGSLSAQFEHTVAVTASGVAVLTLRPDEPGPGPIKRLAAAGAGRPQGSDPARQGTLPSTPPSSSGSDQ